MLKIIKMELKRGFNSIGTILSLLIGFACIGYKNYILISHDIHMDDLIEKSGDTSYYMFNKGNFYNRWIVAYIDPSMLYLFYFLGIIVALPYGISYYNDRKRGIIKNICTRVDKSKYLKAKFASVFITGGTVAVIPVFIDLLISKLAYPYDFINISGTALCGRTKWLIFIIDHMYIAAFLFLVLWFIFGGLLASISLLVSIIADNIFTIQLTPFFIMLFLFYIPTYFPVKYNKYFPYYFLRIHNDYIPTIILLVISSIAFFLIYTNIEKRKDVL